MQKLIPLIAGACGLVLFSCASLEEVIRRPEVEVVGVQIENLTFRTARVRFDIKVTNPNPVGLQLAGYDYDLQIEGATFVRGSIDERVGLEPRGSSIVPVPVEVVYEDLLRTYSNLASRDEFAYRIAVGLSFELPILDRVRVSAAQEGRLPVIRIPRVRVRTLRLDSLTLQGADLTLVLRMNNPNAFGFVVRSLNYRFLISGNTWAIGATRVPVEVADRGQSVVELPFTVRFAEIGRSARDILSGRRPLGYSFEADLGLGTFHPLLGETVLPVRLSGEVGVSR
jgi:LEA14-like dessication related protein